MPPKGKEVLYAEIPAVKRDSSIINLWQAGKFTGHGS